MLTNSPARLKPILRMSLHHQIAVGLVLANANGGLSDTKMIKVYMKHEQPLAIKGFL
jgi:hypothetical protein